MARNRHHTGRYPSVPTLYLIQRHNQLIREEPFEYEGQLVHAWHLVDHTFADRFILSERILHMEFKRNMALKLKPAFGIAPQLPGKFEVAFKSRDGRYNTASFAAHYSAKHFVLAVIDGRSFKWVDADRIRVHDIAIISPFLEEIMDHDFTPDEAAWTLPMPYSYQTGSIAYKRSHAGDSDAIHSSTRARRKSVTRHSGAPERFPDAISHDSELFSSQTTPKSRASKPKAQSDVAFGIDQLASRFERSPKQIRTALRRSGVDKPDAGWQWPADEIEHVARAIKKFLK